MTLKTVIIKGVRIVGMHHYGGRLALEAGYHVRPEPDNPKDKMAVAIKEILCRGRSFRDQGNSEC